MQRSEEIINKMFFMGYFDEATHEACINEIKENKDFDEYITNKFNTII